MSTREIEHVGLSHSMKRRKQITNAAIYVTLSLLCIFWLLPIAWLVLSSLRGETKEMYTSYIIPKQFTLWNYTSLFTDTKLFSFPRWYLNTLLVAVCSCAITTFLTLMVAYTYSRLRFKWRKRFMNISLVLGMFPGFMSMIAIYHFLKAIGLNQSLVALIIVYSGGAALGYYVAKGFFDTVPKALDEAASIDGLTRNGIFWKIILPTSMPIVAYTALTAFIAPWVDFIFVSVIMKDNYANYTVARGLYMMIDREHMSEYYTRFCAGAVLVAIPITALFIKMQKYYVSGVTGGAVKG
ncbi:MAG: sugar ABC transporter permease [Oscillospiraceae bacterium]|jgi:arabinogalactan oligomer/maltooligosaccharide transport system permease protein|nr:sugar ABC transporter permease [Oscillospiraceae bacterium]